MSEKERSLVEQQTTLAELLRAYVPEDKEEASDREAMLGWLEELDHPFSHKQPEAHFTASAIVVNRSAESVCLVSHRHLRRWLQPGGHADESDVDLQETALREAWEETGLELTLHPSAPRPFDLDVHLFPERDGFPAHYHLDLRFLLIAEKPDDPSHRVDESHDARWFTWEEALSLPSESAMKRMLTKARWLSTRGRRGPSRP